MYFICLQVIREKVIERRLPMAILDAEYQFDHHKLVYFFEADRYC
jgi:cell fate regulator YaaT (PSP1 superfamily)